MKNYLLIILVLLATNVLLSQEHSYMKGSVFSIQTNLPLDNVNVVNLNQVKGTITNIKGDFTIRASVNDTLHFSFLGHKSIKIRVTNDMMKYPGTRIGMSELAYTLDEVVITPYRLTGILEIDAKYMPINTNKQYSILGLEKGYEVRGGGSDLGVVGKVLSAISDPAGFLYNTFGSKAKEIRKLKKIKQEDEIRNLLLTKFDRETISEMLHITKEELEEILRHCNYSKDFIKQANDLQILDALSECYDEYKLLKSK